MCCYETCLQRFREIETSAWGLGGHSGGSVTLVLGGGVPPPPPTVHGPSNTSLGGGGLVQGLGGGGGIAQCLLYFSGQATSDGSPPRGGGFQRGHGATDTELAYTPASQASGHRYNSLNSLSALFAEFPGDGGINGRYRLTEWPRHRQFKGTGGGGGGRHV